MIVRNLWDTVSIPENKGKPLYANIKGKEIPLSPQFYIEDAIYYMFPTEDRTTTASIIALGLERESGDDCWIEANGIDTYNSFPDVELMVCDMHDIEASGVKSYNVSDIKEINHSIVLVCEE